ncbi:uncharacterized protein METZ01_LOCUS264719 [marine metagenome]|uniref:Uncharacterized protein n=1 Tax=marine metagenome TaxID=408172 RepID=A0A382JJK7_9ZZZZ
MSAEYTELWYPRRKPSVEHGRVGAQSNA